MQSQMNADKRRLQAKEKDPWVHIRIGMPDVYDGGLAGGLFVAAIVLICLRLPEAVPFMIASGLLGCAVAFLFWLRRR